MKTSAWAASAAQKMAVPPDAPDEKRHQKQREHYAVKNRTYDVDGLDQVLRQVREQGKPMATRPQKNVNHFEAAT